MIYKIKWVSIALSDFEEAVEYISQFNTNAA
jgi:plasmid stabilization system protein ParE